MISLPIQKQPLLGSAFYHIALFQKVLSSFFHLQRNTQERGLSAVVPQPNTSDLTPHHLLLPECVSSDLCPCRNSLGRSPTQLSLNQSWAHLWYFQLALTSTPAQSFPCPIVQLVWPLLQSPGPRQGPEGILSGAIAMATEGWSGARGLVDTVCPATNMQPALPSEHTCG